MLDGLCLLAVPEQANSAEGPVMTIAGDFLSSKNDWVKAVRQR
jgi:hypothetical protein